MVILQPFQKERRGDNSRQRTPEVARSPIQSIRDRQWRHRLRSESSGQHEWPATLRSEGTRWLPSIGLVFWFFVELSGVCRFSHFPHAGGSNELETKWAPPAAKANTSVAGRYSDTMSTEKRSDWWSTNRKRFVFAKSLISISNMKD